ncbi:MAG: hypothetical protein ACI4OL_08000 [Gemmiger sp.]
MEKDGTGNIFIFYGIFGARDGFFVEIHRKKDYNRVSTNGGCRQNEEANYGTFQSHFEKQ